MNRNIATVFLVFSCLFCNSQIGGRYAYQFLNMVTSPRQAALGGKTIAIFDNDVNQAYFNPASINSEMSNKLALNYANYFGKINYGSVAYVFNKKEHNIYAGINYVNYGTFEGYDATGLKTNDFTGNDVALSGGYARKLTNTNIYVGMNLKLISSFLETYKSYGGAIDMGFLYVNNRTNFAFTIRNAGIQFASYNKLDEPLPLAIMLGVSHELEKAPIRWHLTFDNLQQWNIAFSNPANSVTSIDDTVTEEEITFLDNFVQHIVIGGELFSQKKLNLRLGYNFRRGAELKITDKTNFSGFSFGLGLTMKRIKFNYSYARYSSAGNLSMLGLIINFYENN